MTSPNDDPTSGGAGTTPVILVVDDNDINLLVASRMVSLLGCTCIEATNAEAGCTAIAKSPISLVLMDVQMPGMDGLEATRTIRTREQGTGRRLIILGLSAHSLPEDRAAGLDAGMDDYLIKPLTLNVLAMALNRWLPGRNIRTPHS